jgi:putative hemolysin
MGHVIHHYIVATTFTKPMATPLYEYCKQLGCSVTIQESKINGDYTICVGPDGSKSGWEESDVGDQQRKAIKQWLKGQDFEDGSNPYCWVELSMSSDDKEAKIVESRWKKAKQK